MSNMNEDYAEVRARNKELQRCLVKEYERAERLLDERNRLREAYRKELQRRVQTMEDDLIQAQAESEPYKKVRVDSHLLPAPGVLVVRECLQKLEQLNAENQRLREACRIYRGASMQSHNGHWDMQMTGGAYCPECLRAGELRDQADAILRQTEMEVSDVTQPRNY